MCNSYEKNHNVEYFILKISVITLNCKLIL